MSDSNRILGGSAKVASKESQLGSSITCEGEKTSFCSSFVAVDPKGKREQKIRKDESSDREGGVGSRKPDYMSYSSHGLMRA